MKFMATFPVKNQYLSQLFIKSDLFIDILGTKKIVGEVASCHMLLHLLSTGKIPASI